MPWRRWRRRAALRAKIEDALRYAPAVESVPLWAHRGDIHAQTLAALTDVCRNNPSLAEPLRSELLRIARALVEDLHTGDVLASTAGNVLPFTRMRSSQ